MTASPIRPFCRIGFICMTTALLAVGGCNHRRQTPKTVGHKPQATQPVSTESTIRIEFDQPSYTFSLSQAAKGVTIGYRVKVLRELDGMVPRSQLSAPRLGRTGLLPFAWISGNDQLYRVWDFGLGGAPRGEPVTIPAATRRYQLQWDGRNWQGPSDYGAEKGPPFPPGRYTITVRILGQRHTADGKEPYEVRKTAPLILTE